MARKFIIMEDKFLMGNVEYHKELLPSQRVHASVFTLVNTDRKPEKDVLGGGRWDIDDKKKVLYLWGASVDFGYAHPEQIKKTLEDAFLSPSLDGYQVMHSPLVCDKLPEEDTFTLLTTLNQ